METQQKQVTEKISNVLKSNLRNEGTLAYNIQNNNKDIYLDMSRIKAG